MFTLPMVLFPLIGASNHAAAVSIVLVAPALLILVLTTGFVYGGVHFDSNPPL